MITLKHLQAEHFKGLRSVDLMFPERGSVLIEGQNEAGKSTLFEAVYVALYGKPLVGEDNRARQEEVIQYGQSRAIVQLVFRVGQQELTVRRIIEQGKSQQATLTIQQPGVQQEVVTGVKAVDERILKELGNLDGESLRNSCFVEQKELGRIEALSPAKREEAVHKLLGLERLNRLVERFKVKREQERELARAERYLKLARLQAEVRQTSTREREVAEYLDAVKVASQVKHLSDLEAQRGEVEKCLEECTRHAKKARERLERCETLRKQVSYCDQADRQLAEVHHAYEALHRVEEELTRLKSVEQREFPAAEQNLLRAVGDVRLARGYDALTAWVRLKGVEMTLASHSVNASGLVARRKEAELALATARGKTRLPFLAGGALTALAVLTLVLGFLWYPAFALLVCITGGAIIMWLWFFRARKVVHQRSDYLTQCHMDVQRLDMQRQAAIQVGGDPTQYEQQLTVAGIPIPPSLDAGRTLQEELEQRCGAILLQGYDALQEAAKEAQANHVRLTEQLASRALRQEECETLKASFTGKLTTASTTVEELLATLNSLGVIGWPSLPPLSKDVGTFCSHEQALTTTLKEIKDALQATLVTLDEQGARNSRDQVLGEEGRRKQQKATLESDTKKSQQTIDEILSSHQIAHPSEYTHASIVKHWPLVAVVSPGEESQIAEDLDGISKDLHAAKREKNQLAMELGHPGTELSIEECRQKVDELIEERKICELATELLKETRDRIARHILPITERNMHPLLQQLTGGRYRDVRLTPEDSNGQPGEMDYRIRVWDPAAKRFVAKNIFSGGTRDQCSLALRLAFALATLPQELGVAPGFIFLDEPLSAFDAQRAQALVELLTTGTIAQQFNQVVLISHYHAFDREVFQYHIHMENGQIIESDLPGWEAIDVDLPQF